MSSSWIDISRIQAIPTPYRASRGAQSPQGAPASSCQLRTFRLYDGCCAQTALQSGDVERLEMCGLSRRDVAKIGDIIDGHFVCVM